MSDAFNVEPDRVERPSRNAFAITPHASNEVTPLPKAIYVGGAGDVVLRSVDGTDDVTFVGVLAGSIIPVRAKFVRATGTTATGIIGLA